MDDIVEELKALRIKGDKTRKDSIEQKRVEALAAKLQHIENQKLKIEQAINDVKDMLKKSAYNGETECYIKMDDFLIFSLANEDPVLLAITQYLDDNKLNHRSIDEFGQVYALYVTLPT